MYKSLIIVYSDSISRNKTVLFIDKIDIIYFFLNYIMVILLVFRKIKILYYTSNYIKYTKGNIYI